MITKKRIIEALLTYFESKCRLINDEIYLNELEVHLKNLAIYYFCIEPRDIVFKLRAIRGRYL
jgi:hypothetical protein